MLELVCFRESGSRRCTRVIDVLQFVQTTLWVVLFSKAADELQKSTESDDEYMINESEPLVNKYISVPRDMGSFNVSSFAAGVIKGVLDAAGFQARVTAHSVGTSESPHKTTF